MNMNVYKRILVTVLIFSMLPILDLRYLKAAVSPDVNNNLNNGTKAFVGRINQLPQDFVFSKNLKRKDYIYPDITYLKWVLNSDQRTQLSDNPNLTLSELTPSFGPVTEDAVKRFQTVYKSEILDPQGITKPTGTVGPSTRKKLNSLITKSRLIANYSNVVNNALSQQAINNANNSYGSYTLNYTGTSTSIDFSYLDPLNLDNILNNYTSVATSSQQYNQALNTASSSSDQAIQSSNSSNNSNTNSTASDYGSAQVNKTTDPQGVLSKSPEPGIPSTYTLMGVVALTSGDFIGANVASYLGGKGVGVDAAKSQVSEFTSTLSNGQINTGGGGSKGSSGGSSGGAVIAGGALLGGGLLLGGGGAAAGGAAAGAGGAAGSTATGVGTKVVVSQFGGRVIMNMLCPCSANYLITVYDLSLKIPLSVMFQPGISSLKMSYNPTIGETVLGGYIRGTGVCMVYAGVTCTPYGIPLGTIDTLRGIGTTLTPAPAVK
jgi:hypothetical protein